MSQKRSGFGLLIFFATIAASVTGQYFHVPEITIERVEREIDVGGRKLHCFTYGEGAPTVVLVSGFNAPQANWNAVVLGLADEATMVTYDRAGIGKSEIGDLPAHGKQSAIDLHHLLQELDVPRPYVLVGHSYGAGVVRLYASLFPEDLGGLILMDGQHPDILDAQKAALTGEDLERLERMSSARPAVENMKTEADYMMVTLEQRKHIGPLPHIPYIVITAGAHRERGIPPGFSDEARETMVTIGLDMQKKLVEYIPGGRHIILEDVSHMLHLEKPEPVIEIIKGMIVEVQKKMNSREP